jgi:uncharacterized membrane protein
MFDTILGLPVHPLIVHATVVIVPTAALAVAVAAGWPRFRRWAGFGPLLLSLMAIVLVPITTSSGEALQEHEGHSALLERHTEIADGLLLPVLVLAVAAVALYWVSLKELATTSTTRGRLAASADRIGAPGRPGPVVLGIVMIIVAVGATGTLVQVARIGHSGAKAAWSKTRV